MEAPYRTVGRDIIRGKGEESRGWRAFVMVKSKHGKRNWMRCCLPCWIGSSSESCESDLSPVPLPNEKGCLLAKVNAPLTKKEMRDG